MFKQYATKAYICGGNEIPYIITFCSRLSPLSCADFLEIWEPYTPGTMKTCPGQCRDCFTFTLDEGE